MKLVVIGPTHPFRGGASQYGTLLVKALRERHEVFFASYSRQYFGWMYPGSTDRDPSALEVREEPDFLFDAVSPRAWRRLADDVAARAPDLVILPWTVTYWAPFFHVFLRRLSKSPNPPRTAFLCHNIVEHEESTLKRSISRRVLGQANVFITHSREDAAQLNDLLGLGETDRIRTSPHPEYRHLNVRPVDQAAARAKLGITAERVALFFGFVRSYKGIEVLADAMPLVVKELPVHLVVAGEFWDGPRPFLRRLRKLGVESAVTTVPRFIPNEEVPDYFAASDLVVIPYHSATQSGIVQMAYGFERPVVATRVGGLPEMIRDGETGTLVPPRDPAALAAAIVDFFRSGRGPAMRAAIQGRRGEFSWDRMVETIEACAAPRTGSDAGASTGTGGGGADPRPPATAS